jgi:hypothetical protein
VKATAGPLARLKEVIRTTKGTQPNVAGTDIWYVGNMGMPTAPASKQTVSGDLARRSSKINTEENIV